MTLLKRVIDWREHVVNFQRFLSATLVVVAAVAAVVPAGATTFRLGAQLIGSQSSLVGELPDEGSWTGRTGFGAGLVAELLFTSDISISFQPAYAPRGGGQVFKKRQVVLGTIDYDINYFSLPLIVRVTTDAVGVRGFVTVGLDVSILTDATAKTDSTSQDISDGLDSTTLGALFGAGVMVPVSKNFVTFEVRYLQGLTDIIDHGSSTDTGMAPSSVKYRDLELLVGFLFTLGGG
jgi:hypothetical protein